jgi:tetratricopeptide (TPR) repeat protein
MERGDWRKGETLLAKAVEACPVDSDARRQYAETLWRRGARDAALTQIGEARKNAPDDVLLTVRAGEMQLGMGQALTALALADEALDLDPRSAEAWGLRGAALEAQNDFAKALAAYQRALSFEPGKLDMHLAVAETYRKLGQPDRALAALELLDENYPPGEEPQNVLYLEGLALSALGRHGDAVERLKLALQRGKPTADLWSRLAEAEWAAGQPGAAQADIERALAIEPAHAGGRALWEQMQTAHHSEPVLRR